MYRNLEGSIYGRFSIPEERMYQKSTNQKQELAMASMFINGLGLNEQSL
jgi:hypothetical protein